MSEESEAIIAALRTQPRLADFPIAQQRVLFEQVTAQFPMPEGVVCESLDVGGLAAEWITPADVSSDGTVLYLHGGGYVIGSIATDRALAARLALSARMRALLIDYRLAPEHPFPAGIDDAVRAYRWLLERTSAERVVVAGMSGGGGLTMATVLALRNGGDRLPAAAVCMSPWLDVSCESASASRNVGVDPVVTPAWLRTLAGAYLGSADPRGPLASPLMADPAGLPPILLQVGSTEILLDENRAFAQQARGAGVDVTLDEWPGMFHFWQAYAHILPEAREAIERAGAFIRGRLSVRE